MRSRQETPSSRRPGESGVTSSSGGFEEKPTRNEISAAQMNQLRDAARPGRSPRPDSRLQARGAALDQPRPRTIAGTATARPASGPAAAMSNETSRLRAGERIRMIAPRVPQPNGSGMKYGRLTAFR